MRNLAAVALLIASALTPSWANDEAAIKAKLASVKPKDFPTQPIELMVAYGAGGGMDLTARKIAKIMERLTDHRVVVNNRTGGGGVVGHTYLTTQAANDGYTLALLTNTIWADGLLRSGGKWTHRDTEALSFVNYDATQWVVAKNGPFANRTAADIVAAAKEKPGTIRVGIIPGTDVELLINWLEKETGARFLKVPFQTNAQGVAAVLGGHLETSVSYLPEYSSHMAAGTITPVAIASGERISVLPNTPTFKELFPGNITLQSWRYVGAPKGMPADRKAYLVAALNAALADPELVEDFKRNGQVTHRQFETPAAVEAEVERLFAQDRERYHLKTN